VRYRTYEAGFATYTERDTETQRSPECASHPALRWSHLIAATPDPKRNHLLAALPDSEWQRWFPQLEFVELELGEVL
jgi:hypothetical protein